LSPIDSHIRTRRNPKTVTQNQGTKRPCNELPGVLNRALQGWGRLQRKGHFTKSLDMRIASKLFVAHANPLQGFIDECCEKADDGRIKLDEFYRQYKIWAEDSGFTMTQTKPNVRKNLENMGYGVPRHNVGRVIRGLKLRDAKF
jgi:phage/plasmid-associated DNA primase